MQNAAGDGSGRRREHYQKDQRQHLAELGFVVGEEVQIVSEMGGNLILAIKGARIALDKTMAMRIMV